MVPSIMDALKIPTNAKLTSVEESVCPLKSNRAKNVTMMLINCTIIMSVITDLVGANTSILELVNPLIGISIASLGVGIMSIT